MDKESITPKELVNLDSWVAPDIAAKTLGMNEEGISGNLEATRKRFRASHLSVNKI